MPGSAQQVLCHFQELVEKGRLPADAFESEPVVGERPSAVWRHGLRESVDGFHGPAERFRGVANGGADPVGDDGGCHGGLLHAKAFFDPGDDFVSAFGIEVHVDVGRALATRVQEAFEE